MIERLAEGEGRAAEGVAQTIQQPLRHSNSIWSSEDCGEESGDHHLKHKGAPLEAEGWDADAELDLDGYYVHPDEARARQLDQILLNAAEAK